MKFITILKELLLELSGEEIYKKYYSDLPSHIFKNLVKYDPQTHISNDNILKLGRFSKLIINLFKLGSLKNEDLPKVKEYLGYIYKYKIPLNINKISSLPELYKIIEPYIVKSNKDLSVILQTLPKNQYKVLHNGEKWYIFQPLTETAACQIGVNTEWCTTWGKESLNPNYRERSNYFERYNKQSPLYIIIDKTNLENKYQFHFNSKQYMDKMDKKINVVNFLNNNLEIKKYFFPSLFTENVSDDMIKNELERVDALSTDDVMKIINKNVDGTNPLINNIIDKDENLEQTFKDSFKNDNIDYVNITENNRIEIVVYRLSGDLEEVESNLNYLQYEKNNVYETLREDIIEYLNNDDKWENFANNLFKKYYDENSSAIRTHFGIYNFDDFRDNYFEEFMNEEKIKDTFIDNYLDINISNFENEIQEEIDKIEKYLNFNRMSRSFEIGISLPFFILYLKNNEINDFDNFKYIEDLFNDFINFYDIPTYYEPTYLTDVTYPDYSNRDIEYKVEKFFEYLKTDDDADCEQNRKDFNYIYTKVFNKKSTIENNKIFLKINSKTIDCVNGTVNVTYKNKETGKTYTGEVKIKNLPNYVFNYQLFESLITFKKNILL